MATAAQKGLQCLRVCVPIALILHVTYCTAPSLGSSHLLAASLALYLAACLAVGAHCFATWAPGPLRHTVLLSGPCLALLGAAALPQWSVGPAGLAVGCLCPVLYVLFDGTPAIAVGAQLLCCALPALAWGWGSVEPAVEPADAMLGCPAAATPGYSQACVPLLALALHLALLCRVAEWRAETQELQRRLHFFTAAMGALTHLDTEAVDSLIAQHRLLEDAEPIQQIMALLKGLCLPESIDLPGQDDPTPSDTPKSAHSRPSPIPCDALGHSATLSGAYRTSPETPTTLPCPTARAPSPCGSRKGSLDSSGLSDLSPTARKRWDLRAATSTAGEADAPTVLAPSHRFAPVAPALFSPTAATAMSPAGRPRPPTVAPLTVTAPSKMKHRKANVRSRSDGSLLDPPRPAVRRREADCRWLIDPARRPRAISFAHREAQAANLSDEWQTVLSRTRMQRGLWQWSLLLWCASDGAFLFRAGVVPADFAAVDEPIGIADGINQHGSIRTDAVNRYLEGWPSDLSFREMELLLVVDLRQRRLCISRPLSPACVTTSFRHHDVRLAVSLLGCRTYAKVVSVTFEE
eukprot:EG_transcript_6446